MLCERRACSKQKAHYVPMCLFFRTKARESARMQAQCECNRTSGEQCSIYGCECLASSYVRKKRHMCLMFRTSGKQRRWPVCVSMKLAELGLGEPCEKMRPKRHLADKCTSVYLERQWCPESHCIECGGAVDPLHCIALCGRAIGIH